MKEKIYRAAPNFIQNILISIYNWRAYRDRYGGLYKKYRAERLANRSLTLKELREYQSHRYKELINFAIENSDYYRNAFEGIDKVSDINNIKMLPILSKETLQENINFLTVKTNQKLKKSKTGGTTGKSLEVKNFKRDYQERFAFLDDFRSRFGYKLGRKTAWFSGKNLLTKKDVYKNRFWKNDFLNNVRYYSSFHIRETYLKYYVEDLIKYQPEYLVGFPSTIFEIAKYGRTYGFDFPPRVIKAIFPTAETVTFEMRKAIEFFFKSRIYDQYASSEGAPFIFECEEGNLHIEMQSGVFEVLNEDNMPTKSGRLVVTSFTNKGTPLIRYDIGDSIEFGAETRTCSCGNHNPIVTNIMGRIDDFIYSPERGKINLGNVSNTLKGTIGIIRFQAVQDNLEEIELLLVVDNRAYSQRVEKMLLRNWKARIGDKMKINIKYVKEIPVEKSGKFRLVKNNVKHLI